MFNPSNMYFCYVDESGDSGIYNPANPSKSGSRYFILAGVVVAVNRWKQSLASLKAFRKDIAAKAYLPYDIEFHCAEMIDPHKTKEFTQIAVKDRWMLIEQFAEAIASHAALKVIAVVIDKTSSALEPADYLTTAITRLYQAFDGFLKSVEEQGLVLFDRANERVVSTHVRKLMGTGSSGTTIPGIRIGWVIEDPIFRISADSIFIQAADVVAYTLKEKEFPQASRKKFQADRIFERKLGSSIIISEIGSESGIIRV